jgi:hypothetical protein
MTRLSSWEGAGEVLPSTGGESRDAGMGFASSFWVSKGVEGSEEGPRGLSSSWTTLDDADGDGDFVIPSRGCEEAGGGRDLLCRRLGLGFDCQGVDEG